MNGSTRSSFILTIVVLTASVFSLFTSMGLVAALLVNLSGELGTTVAVAGQLLTISAVVWGLASPIVGPISDRVGRKRVVITGLLISGISLLGYGIAWDFSALIGFSVLVGLGGAMAGPNILGSVGDYFQTGIHGRIMAIVNTGLPLAYLAGVPAGALIADSLGWRASFLVLGLFIVAIAVVDIVVLPSSRTSQSNGSIAYLSSFREAFHQKTLFPLMFANTLANGAYFTVDVYLAAFLIRSYSLSIGQVAPLISYMAMGHLAGMLIGGQLADKFNKIKICVIMQALCGLIGVALMQFPRDVWLSVLLGGLFSGISSSTRPAFFSITVTISSNVRGTIMGVQGASNHLGRALGAMAGGLVLTLIGYNFIGVLSLVFSLAASAIFLYVYVHLRTFLMDTQGGKIS